MSVLRKSAFVRIVAHAALCVAFCGGFLTVDCSASSQATPAAAQAQPTSRSVGTIKAISGTSITLTTDAGNEVTILLQDTTKLLRLAPGQTSLKEAAPITLAELQVGDRILVGGKLASDGKSVLATSLVAMKKADIVSKQAHEREDWQKHSVGGVVSSVDAATSTILIALPAIGEKKTVTVHVSNTTVLRRYSPDSIKFDDAKVAPLSEIRPGDQLRARGARNVDGSELSAEEIVSGTFRNISGLISSVDPSSSTVTVQDLATKKPVTIKITADSQLRKLPPATAQRIAARLKGFPADAPTSAASNAGQTATQPTRISSSPGNGSAQGIGGSGGSGRSAGTPAPDLQQAINRIPAATLVDFQKGDAVMLVATEGSPNSAPTAITLLGGVETILEAPNSTTILSAWSLGGAPGGEATAQ